MSNKHGAILRGLMSTPKSPSFQGRFGRMFRSLPAAQFGLSEAEAETNLNKLGDAMSSDFDPPKDGKDDEESGIPALYTYFGQFIDHDITFDPSSSLQKQNDPNALTDFRTPAFDLDNVYGRGPGDQPYMYNGDLFLLGSLLNGGDANSQDLPRNSAQVKRALIGDPRNDENTIVSQLQGLFLRFHNRMRTDNPSLPFEDIQRLVRFHYQYVVLNDFIPKIIQPSVLHDLKSGGHWDSSKLRFFHWKNEPFMPVEFSVAAYRLGHSMVRPGYRLNDNVLLPIFPSPPQFLEGLTGFREMNPNWGIDWGRFIDIEVRKYDGTAAENAKRLQFAYRLDTSLVNPLKNLPPSVVSDAPPSLAGRNLIRAWRLGLPSGQAVARAMGLKPLRDKDILIGKAVDGQLPSDITQLPNANVFKGNCPLWTYILAEAMHHKQALKVPVQENVVINTPQLGPVGGRIVAEVFLGLMFGDKTSYLSLDPNWEPQAGSDYKLKDFVKYALGQ
jgi:hypothetical protein